MSIVSQLVTSFWCSKMITIQLSNKHVILTWCLVSFCHQYDQVLPAGCLHTLGTKNLTKLLYLSRFRRYRHFCVFAFLSKIRKLKKKHNFGKEENFWKLGMVSCLDTLRAENFHKIAAHVYPTAKEIQAILCFSWHLSGLHWPIYCRPRPKFKA